VERQGRLCCSRCASPCGMFGEPTEARVRVRGSGAVDVPLQPGPASFEVAVPGDRRPRPSAVTVEAAANRSPPEGDA